MKENKGYTLHFLEETEADARTTERNGTFQLEVLKEIHPWEELEAAIKTEWVQTEGGVKADFGATVRRIARNEEANLPRCWFYCVVPMSRSPSWPRPSTLLQHMQALSIYIGYTYGGTPIYSQS